MSLLRILAPFAIMAATLAFIAATSALAQPPEGARRPPDIAKLLGLDARRATQVDAILKVQREKVRAVHEETERQLATVLTAEELAKLREARPPRPAPN